MDEKFLLMVNMKRPYPKNVPEIQKSGKSWIRNWFSHIYEAEASKEETHFCCNTYCENGDVLYGLSDLRGSHVKKADNDCFNKIIAAGGVYITALCPECNGKAIDNDGYGLDDVMEISFNFLVPISKCSTSYN